MNKSFHDRFNKLLSIDASCLQGIQRGVEKESLRVDRHGKLAQTPHPKKLGSSLCHPMITTDYSESLLEFITPPSDSLNGSLDTLFELHQFAQFGVGKELLWPGSMPCQLLHNQEVPIAQYGTSNQGMMKHVYRRGLDYRYGRLMQTISGVHYNFSFPKSFWEQYQELLGNKSSQQEFISDQYLHLIRNAQRYGWILPLLFGASPVIGRSLVKGDHSGLEEWERHLLVGPYATALRLGDSGYSNNIQARLHISLNSLEEFVESMNKAIHTRAPEYARDGIQKDGKYFQLSENILQVEDEYYAEFRPKRMAKPAERMLSALARDGVEYIEIRALDVDPFVPTGIRREGMCFSELFLLTCLVMDGPKIEKVEKQRIERNHAHVIASGRKPGLMLLDDNGTPRAMKDLAFGFIEYMQMCSTVFDKAFSTTQFHDVCEYAKDHIQDMSLLPSSQLLEEMKSQKLSYDELMCHKAEKYKGIFEEKPLTEERQSFYEQLATKSIEQQAKLEAESGDFDHYLREYLEF